MRKPISTLLLAPFLTLAIVPAFAGVTPCEGSIFEAMRPHISKNLLTVEWGHPLLGEN
jgi:hypothetical protein